MNEEKEHWRRLIDELQSWGVTLGRIAEHLGVSERQVTNWKNGQRPTGLIAVRLTMFHDEQGRVLHGRILHSAQEK